MVDMNIFMYLFILVEMFVLCTLIGNLIKQIDDLKKPWVLPEEKDPDTVKKEVNQFLMRDRDLVVEQMNNARDALEDSRRTLHWYDDRINELRQKMVDGISVDEAEDISDQLEMYQEERTETVYDIKKAKKDFSSWSRTLSLIDKQW